VGWGGGREGGREGGGEDLVGEAKHISKNGLFTYF